MLCLKVFFNVPVGLPYLCLVCCLEIVQLFGYLGLVASEVCDIPFYGFSLYSLGYPQVVVALSMYYFLVYVCHVTFYRVSRI